VELGARELLGVRGRFAVDAAGLPLARLALCIGAAAGGYGLVMGSLEARWLGGVYSASKLPLLVFGATLLCLPNFYVVNALLGLRADFRSALRGILAAQGTVALCLGALAPVLALFYVSRVAYPTALLLNGVLFAVAVLGGQSTLRRHCTSSSPSSWAGSCGPSSATRVCPSSTCARSSGWRTPTPTCSGRRRPSCGRHWGSTEGRQHRAGLVP
jgi:hypothetical protein